MDDSLDPFFDGGLSDELIERYERMMQKGNPTFFDVDEFQSLIFHYGHEGRFREAVQVVEAAKRQHPQSTEIALTEAELLSSHNRPHRALTVINKIAAIEPFNIDVLITKGTILVGCKNFNEAAECFEQAVDLTTDEREKGRIYMDFGFLMSDSNNPEYALEILDKSLMYPESENEALSEMSFIYETEQMFHEAVSYFSNYVDENPYSYAGWHNLASAYEHLDAPKEALRCYDFASIVNPEDSIPHFNKAMCLKDMEHYEEAVSELKEALKYEAGMKTVHYRHIAEIYALSGDYYLAEKFYLKVCRTENSPFGKELLGDSFVALSEVVAAQDRQNEAFTYAKKAVEVSPKNYKAWLNLAEFQSARQFPEAEESFEQALKYGKRSAETWVGYGDHLYFQGREKEAFELLNNGCEELPGESEIYYKFAACLVKSGQNEDAKEILEIGLKINKEKANGFLEDVPEAKNLPFVIDLLNEYNA